MPASPLDSAIYRHLFGDPEVAKLFTDSAEVRAMLVVEGALAKAQGTLGMIPETAAAAIHRDAMEVVLDPAALSAETGRSAVPVPALVDAFRTAMQAPDHAQFVHWGATSQDIIETGLTLRLRQALVIAESRLTATRQGAGNTREIPRRNTNGRPHLRPDRNADVIRCYRGQLGRTAAATPSTGWPRCARAS